MEDSERFWAGSKSAGMDIFKGTLLHCEWIEEQ